VTRLLPLQPVALGAEVVDLVEHPVEQRLGRDGGYAGALKLPDLTALPLNLATHVLYFAANELDVRHPSALRHEGLQVEQKENTMQAAKMGYGDYGQFHMVIWIILAVAAVAGVVWRLRSGQ
jgi:hypothetical protein